MAAEYEYGFWIDTGRHKNLFASGGVLTPIVQHVKFVQTEVDAAGQMHIQLDWRACFAMMSFLPTKPS